MNKAKGKNLRSEESRPFARLKGKPFARLKGKPFARLKGKLFAAIQGIITIQGSSEMMKQYYVYILASKSRTLYTGVTDDLVQRVFQHKNKLIQGFTKKYNVTNLVYYEATSDVQAAVQRERQIKGWLRRKKIALIKTTNREWKDLSEGWYET